MYVKVIEDMEVEPIDLEELKEWLRIDIDYTAEDNILTNLIKSSRILLENYTGLSFGTKTLEAVIDIANKAEVPYSPLQSMTSVYRRNEHSWVLCVEGEDYWILNNTIEVSLPAMYKLTYVAGYEDLPEPLKTDIKVIGGWQYENRGIKFNESGTALTYPFLNLLNARYFKKIVI